jgi:hypothetical protein
MNTMWRKMRLVSRLQRLFGRSRPTGFHRTYERNPTLHVDDSTNVQNMQVGCFHPDPLKGMGLPAPLVKG